jgi:hypothetical protein
LTIYFLPGNPFHQTSAGLCVVTTRFEIADVKSWPETAPQHELLRLSMQAGVEVLQSIGVKGSLTPGSGTSFNSKPLNEYEALVEDVDGHALTLQILGQYLVRAHRGDIRRRDRIDFATAEAKIPGGPGFHADHAFRTIAAYEAWLADDSEESRRELAVLRLLGLFDRPATADCVQALLKAPAIDGLTDPLVDLPDEDWEFTLTTLSDARLVSVNRAEGTGELLSLDAHPLIREYFAERMKDEGGRMKENDSTFRLQLSAFILPPSSLATVGCTNTSARRRRKATSPRSKICSRFIRPSRMDVTQGCTKSATPTSTCGESCGAEKATAHSTWVRSGQT